MSPVHNVSDDLANYLTMALDVTVGPFAEFMKTQFAPGEYQAILDEREAELQDVMLKGNFSDAVELFQALAVRCQDFINYCDAQRHIMITDEMVREEAPRPHN